MEAKVKIFTSPTCPYCKMTKEFLEGKGIEYINYDITNKEAMAEMQRVTGGARTVPVIAICQDVIIGFDKNRVEEALKCLYQDLGS